MLGGTVLLSSAFSFGTNVAADFAVGKAVDTYEHSKFVRNSVNMTTLPLPNNAEGPNSYEEGFGVLKAVNAKEMLSSSHNQEVVQSAVQVILRNKKDLGPPQMAREQALMALLYFIQPKCLQTYTPGILLHR
jgi:hypothetical protein